SARRAERDALPRRLVHFPEPFARPHVPVPDVIEPAGEQRLAVGRERQGAYAYFAPDVQAAPLLATADVPDDQRIDARKLHRLIDDRERLPVVTVRQQRARGGLELRKLLDDLPAARLADRGPAAVIDASHGLAIWSEGDPVSAQLGERSK